MAFVCKWLGLYLCMREPPPNTENLLADKCNILVVLKEERTRESSGGLAFEVILKPATVDSPQVVKNPTPTKEISFEFIEKKLQEAKERRESMEASRLTYSLKDKQRCTEANLRIQELNDSFAREVEKKLAEKMESTIEKKNSRISVIQERLKEHAHKVEEVRRRCEQDKFDLREKIERKLEIAEEKREAMLSNIQDRIRKHQEHVNEVIESSSKFSKDTEEKLIQKLEASQTLREQQLNILIERLRDHERRRQQVRQNKLNQSSSSESIGLNDSLSGNTGCSASVSETDMGLVADC